MEAATAVFLKKGYLGASMDEVAATAGVSKQTVYKHFTDKDRLFREIVLATTDEVAGLVRLVASTLDDTQDLEKDLANLGRRFISRLMEPQLLRLRRLIIANAERLPDVGRTWYERGFGRALATLAGCFERLAKRELLRLDDPTLAAHHFVGLLLWIPVNQAMFTGHRSSKAELERYADAAVRTFLAAYGITSKPALNSVRRSETGKGRRANRTAQAI